MASESKGSEAERDAGHRNHFALIGQGMSWSGREPNVLFQARGDGTYDELGNVLGLASRLDARGASSVDLDADGDLDLVVYNRNHPRVQVFRNDAPGQGNVLQVDLQAKDGNRDAIGAQAIARCGDLAQLRQVSAGGGYLSQEPLTLHFGLGGCEQVDALEVRWPSGREETFRDLPVDRRIRIAEGEADIQTLSLEPRNHNAAEYAEPAGEISAPIPAADLPWLEGEGSLALADLSGTAVLNFWATWCTACIAEMPDLEALHQELGPEGVRFLGVIMDEPELEAEVRAFAEDRGVGYEQVWGDLEIEGAFAELANAPLGAIPLTAVVHEGYVRYLKAGRIDPEDLARRLRGLQALR